jgi:hypothetical protein
MPYNSARARLTSIRKSIAVKEKNPMKRAIRTSVLVIGLVGTYVMAAVPQVPALDGGSIPLCPPSMMLGHCR